MAGNDGNGRGEAGRKGAAAAVLLVVGVVADVVGIMGTVASWGATETRVVVAESATTTTAGAATGTAPGSSSPTSSSAPTGETTAPPTAETTAPAPASVEEFLVALGAAFAAGDAEFAFARLHPQVVVRYGEAACRDRLAGMTDPTAKFVVVSVGEPTTYAWVSDGLSADIPSARSVDVVRTAGGVEESVTVHVAEFEGTQRWFTDCGDPLG